jgi:alpha-tubulin suppressor-like RCC1 family protein
MYSTLALKANGEVWSWGNNVSGILGTGNVTLYSSPVIVVGAHSFVSVTAFNYSNVTTTGSTLALKANGEVWAWGYNASGQLGTGNTTSYSSPVLVVGSHSFVQIKTSGNHTIGLKADGSAWAWGLNTSGELGDNTVTGRSSPVLVVGGHSFCCVKTANQGAFSFGLKSTGELWAWGINSSGQLGDGSRTDKSSPVLVVGGHSFLTMRGGLDHSVALKEDGKAWAWGLNDSGQLGTGNTTSFSSPVLVVGPLLFTNIDTGHKWTISLVNTGAAWAWGNNLTGNLGTGNVTSYSSPVAVVGGHYYNQIAAGRYHCLGLKANSLWAWGYNDQGQVGNNTRTSYSSPVLVVGSHNFQLLMNTNLDTPSIEVGYGLRFHYNQSLSSVNTWTPPENCTVSFWLYNQESAITRSRIMGHSTTWEIYMVSGKISNDMHWATSLLSSTSLTKNVLYHIVTTRASDNTLQIYINGILDASSSGGSGVVAAATLRIGMKENLSQYLKGFLEDVRIYNRVLSSDEIKTIYSCQGCDGIVYGLQHRFLFNEKPIGTAATGTGSIKCSGPDCNDMTPDNSPVYSGSRLKLSVIKPKPIHTDAYSIRGIPYLQNTIGGFTPHLEGQHIWGDNTFVYLAADGLYSYSVDATGGFSQRGYHSGIGAYNEYGLHGDGRFIYMGSTGGLASYQADATGGLILKDSTSGVPPTSYTCIWSDSSYIFTGVAADPHTIRSYSADSSGILTLVDSTTMPTYPRFPENITGDSRFIYVSLQDSGIQVYSRDASGLLSLKSTYLTAGYNYKGIWSDSTYIYTAAKDSSNFYRAISLAVDASGIMTTITDLKIDPYPLYGVWSRGDYIYYSLKIYDGDGPYSGLRTFRRDALGQLTWIASTGTCARDKYTKNYPCMGIWGDGTYIYSTSYDPAILKSYKVY